MKIFSKQELINLYSKTGLINNVQSHQSPPSNYAARLGIILEGIITVLEIDYRLTIFVSEKFPLNKPSYSINCKEIDFTPHIDPLGEVCYTKDEGIFWDYTNPEGLIYESLLGALNTIKDGIAGKNKKDLLSEFEYYWLVNKSTNKGLTAYLHANLANEVRILNTHEDSKLILIAERKKDLLDYYGFDLNKFEEMLNKKKVLYIPFNEDALVYPPKYSEFWNPNTVYQLIEQNVSIKNKHLIGILLSKRSAIDNIIFRLKQPNGSYAFFGIKYINISNRKFSPILHIKNKSEIIPIIVNNRAKDYLATRGGGNMDLSNKDVAIIGCGSLGGNIAPELLKCGINNLTLIDNDIFKSENIYRHYLGREYVGKYKSEALKTDLEKKIPYTKITSFNKKIEDLIYEDINFLEKYDLVIVATGNPTINLFLNKYCYNNKKGLPVIYTWLDPFGIGGHTLLTNNNTKGCYDCLYEDLHNKASFAMKGQKFAKSISGCGSLYTPYGSIDTIETVVQVIRLSLKVLSGKEKQNPIISWKGNPDEFLKEGFELSDRFEQTTEMLEINRNSYINDSCEVCNKND